MSAADGRGAGHLDWPAGQATLTVQHTGSGSPWINVRTTAAIPLRAPLFAGYTVQRRLVPSSSGKRVRGASATWCASRSTSMRRRT